MHLITKRCTVRNFKESDIPDFIKYRNDEKWMKFQGFKCRSEQEYKYELLKDPNLEEGCQFAVTKNNDNSLLGDVFLRKCGDSYWIGYTISPEYARQGYAYEVICSIVRYLKVIGAKKAIADVDPNNIPSVKLLEKLNFILVKQQGTEYIYSIDLED